MPFNGRVTNGLLFILNGKKFIEYVFDDGGGGGGGGYNNNSVDVLMMMSAVS